MRLAGMILAAGLGSRMGALTADTPKPLISLGGTPMLGHIVDRLEEAGTSDIFVNLHYRAAQMRKYLDGLDAAAPVRSRVEPRLSGPAGALRLFRDELSAFDAVLVSSADVLVGESLSHLVATHVARPAALTFACTRTLGARHYGVLEIDPDGSLTGAREKPNVPDDEVHWISAGVYCIDPLVIGHIAADAIQDFARDLAPALLDAGHRIGVHRLAGYWRDIGTADALRAAEADIADGRIPWLAGHRPAGA